jgi:hypothetical protein
VSDSFTLTGDADLSAATTTVDDWVADQVAKDVTLPVKAELADEAELTATITDVDDSAVDTAVDDIEGTSIEMKKPVVPAPDTTAVTTATKNLRGDSDQTKSVLANMSGNVAQDLGEIGGAAGSTGVLIGQLAEYATEGNVSLRNLTKLAGPMLGLTAVSIVATKAFEAWSKRSKELAENTAKLTESFVASTGGIDQWTSTVEKAVEAGTADPEEMFSASFFEAWDEDKANDVLAALGDIGLSAGDLGEQMLGATQDTQAWATEQLKAAGASDEFAAAVGEAMANGADYGEAVAIAAQQHTLMTGALDETGQALIAEGEALGVAGEALDELTKAAKDADIEQAASDALNAAEGYEEYAGMVAQARDETDSEADALARFQELMIEANAAREEAKEKAKAQAEADAEAAKALEEAAAGADEYARAMNSVDWQAAELEGAATAMTTYSEALFASGNHAQDSADAYTKLADSLADSELQFDQATEAGFAQQDALEQLAGVVDQDLAKAFDTANGSFDAFASGAKSVASDIRGTLMNDLGLTVDQADEVLDALGLLDDKDIEARFELAGAEEARLKLGLLSSAIAGLPADIEREVTLAVAAGDYQTALKIVEDYYADNHPEVIADVTADASQYGDVVGAAVRDAEGNITVIPVDADPAEAEEEMEETADNPPEATIPADADTTEAARQLLDETTRQRQATIYAIAAITSAKIALDSLKARRTAIIEAEAHTLAAETELNHVARTRYATIITRTSSGGGTRATAPAGRRLSAAPAAAPPVYAPNITINTAVIGDRFDTQRVVTRALRGHARIAGARLAGAEAGAR